MSFLLPKTPKIPAPLENDDEEIEAEKNRQLALRRSGGKSSLILSGGAGLATPMLGQAAQLTGGL